MFEQPLFEQPRPDAAGLLLAVVLDCQTVLNGSLPPNGYSAEEAVGKLRELLDGPRWSEAEEAVAGEE